jgi:hypothetical protein
MNRIRMQETARSRRAAVVADARGAVRLAAASKRTPLRLALRIR